MTMVETHELGAGWAGRGWAASCTCGQRFPQRRDRSAADADVADHLLEVRLAELLTAELVAGLGRKGRRRLACGLVDVAGELQAVVENVHARARERREQMAS